MHTISARQLQREYKKVLAHANKINKPVIVMSNNKPQGALIGLDLLERLQLDKIASEALEEYRQGKTTSLSRPEELETYLKDIEKE